MLATPALQTGGANTAGAPAAGGFSRALDSIVFPPYVREQQDERAALIFSVPELRMRMLDEMVRVTEVLADLLAKRIGRQPDDFAMQALAGAVIGVGIAAWINAKGRLASNYLGLMDQAFAQLEEGFNF